MKSITAPFATLIPAVIGLCTACSNIGDPATPSTTTSHLPSAHLPVDPAKDFVLTAQDPPIPPPFGFIPNPSTRPLSPGTEPSYGLVIPPQDDGRAVIIDIPPPPGFASAMPVLPPRVILDP